MALVPVHSATGGSPSARKISWAAVGSFPLYPRGIGPHTKSGWYGCDSYDTSEERTRLKMASGSGDSGTTAQSARSDWLAPLLWGGMAIVTGILLFARPAVTLPLLARIIATFWIIGGIIDIGLGLRWRDVAGRGWRVAGALLCILAGIVVLRDPLVGTAIIVGFAYLLISGSALLSGAVNLFAGWRSGSTWGQLLLGVFQIVVGLWLLARPLVALSAFLDLLATVFVVGGVILVAQAQYRAVGPGSRSHSQPERGGIGSTARPGNQQAIAVGTARVEIGEDTKGDAGRHDAGETRGHGRQ